ncbi:anaerobic ribonucleoside triphosphate reductase [Aerococcus urinaehominis]|uniref:Anaerobic ribonucleoside triphosphate reductase n=1 Tax=Aerococcus urinaehominis TaxID=128944 RepID=A0A0X8FKZ6_9LACT|nr:anaerobic ribonucleoside-triphosphate reductase [Aerococcus urinaehominis]AMB99230.1 anaerobic ribonucleoside triphosphate reductase [Aerococcus urinaehominis]SDM31697.1 ribonucleoside-triphosphate reductase class III catalytic subunit [Aerococcus urinaehominis]
MNQLLLKAVDKDKMLGRIISKYDGSKAHFRPHQIERSLALVLKDLNPSQKDLIYQHIYQELANTAGELSSQQISQTIISVLEEAGFHQAAQNYYRFGLDKRQKRQKQENVQVKLDELLAGNKRIINENANKDSRVFNTGRDLTAGVSAKAIGLAMMPKAVANAHLKGDIHYHDLDYQPYSPMTNCCLIDFKEMLANGFHIGNAEVESPKSVNTAAAQIAQIVANVASSQYGGCSADRIDEVLAPYAKLNFEKHLATAQEWIAEADRQEAYAYQKTEKDIYDAMQSLEYEINTLYSSNGQTPFTTLGFGLGQDWFSREIQKAILKIRIQGLGREKRTAIFPKLVFTLKDGTNLKPTDPNYDIKQLALECASKRMYPDVLMYDKIVDITGSFKAPMGCRSFLQAWQDEAGRDVSQGRMNLGVVTLNLPRIALEAHGDQAIFWQILAERIEIARQALVYRVERTKEAKPENAPILYQHGAFGQRLASDDQVDELFKNKRATISLGYIGLYEVATSFYGPEWENNTEAKDFTLNILKALKEQTDHWGQQYGYHFSLYATPSESLTDRFCQLDLAKFGEVADITDKGYYTNSFHYDVRKNPSPFEKLTFEAPYPQYSSGGFIHYCEYPNLRHNPKALEAVWDFAYDKVGYLGTNTPIDHCYQCGFDGEFDPTAHGFKCPECGNNDPESCDVVKRTCGYLGNPQIRPMVEGRQKEINARVKHMRTTTNFDNEGDANG